MVLTSHPVRQISGTIRAPGDKSCSHRAFMLAGLADGVSDVTGLLEGEDVLKTGQVMTALGAETTRLGQGHWRIRGVGKSGLSQPNHDLDFGNAGTGVRLMMGLMAGYPISARLVGDTSLSSRPMGRVINPLEQMGVTFEHGGDQTLPLTEIGTARLQPIDYAPPHASAQVKSCLLLAGLQAEGLTIIRESRLTRDHSEKMLRGFGAEIDVTRRGDGADVSLHGRQFLSAQETSVPGDPSSVAFLAAAALIAERGGTVVEGVMSNETRDGFFRAAAMMGAGIGAEETGEAAGERLIDMSFEASDLKGADIPLALVPSMIDEFPILAVLAAVANGVTRVSGAEEMRIKESDRISAVVQMLRVNGVAVEEHPDGFTIEGCNGPVPGDGLVKTHHDHRIAMSALVMGIASKAPISIDDASMIATSYPDFLDHMARLGADIRKGPA